MAFISLRTWKISLIYVNFLFSNNSILNASPLICLGKAKLLEIISPLASARIIPQRVIDEVEVKYSITTYKDALASQSQVRMETIKTIPRSIAAWDLGLGESEVLTIALKTPGTYAVLDDLQARKCATLFHIPLIGSLGLILLAKQRGLISLAQPSIDAFMNAGLYVSPDMLTRILPAIGEKRVC